MNCFWDSAVKLFEKLGSFLNNFDRIISKALHFRKKRTLFSWSAQKTEPEKAHVTGFPESAWNGYRHGKRKKMFFPLWTFFLFLYLRTQLKEHHHKNQFVSGFRMGYVPLQSEFLHRNMSLVRQGEWARLNKEGAELSLVKRLSLVHFSHYQSSIPRTFQLLKI